MSIGDPYFDSLGVDYNVWIVVRVPKLTLSAKYARTGILLSLERVPICTCDHQALKQACKAGSINRMH